jgi:hypothetical protein
MVAYELTSAILAGIILLPVGFFAVFLYLRALAIGAMKFYFYKHDAKLQLYLLIAKFI